MGSTVDITNFMPVLYGLLGSGVLVTLVAQALKKLPKLEREEVIHTMVVVLSVAAAVAQYVFQIKGQLPLKFLGVSTLTIFGVSQIVYKYAGYGLNFLSRVQIVDGSQTSASQADAAVAAVNVPADAATTEPIQANDMEFKG